MARSTILGQGFALATADAAHDGLRLGSDDARSQLGSRAGDSDPDQPVLPGPQGRRVLGARALRPRADPGPDHVRRSAGGARSAERRRSDAGPGEGPAGRRRRAAAVGTEPQQRADREVQDRRLRRSAAGLSAASARRSSITLTTSARSTTKTSAASAGRCRTRSGTKTREEVIYIDHNHLHMVGNVDTGCGAKF